MTSWVLCGVVGSSDLVLCLWQSSLMSIVGADHHSSQCVIMCGSIYLSVLMTDRQLSCCYVRHSCEHFSACISVEYCYSSSWECFLPISSQSNAFEHLVSSRCWHFGRLQNLYEVEPSWRNRVTRDRETGGRYLLLVLTQALFFLICQHMNRTVCKLLPPRAEPLGQPRLPCRDGLYPWKLWAKINYSSLELLLFGSFRQWEEKLPKHIHTQKLLEDKMFSTSALPHWF